MGATLKSEGAGLVRTACECVGRSGRIRIFALMKAEVPSQPWNRLLLLYIALLAASVHGNGKFCSWRARRGAVLDAQRDARAPRLAIYIIHTVYTMDHLPVYPFHPFHTCIEMCTQKKMRFFLAGGKPTVFQLRVIPLQELSSSYECS